MLRKIAFVLLALPLTLEPGLGDRARRQNNTSPLRDESRPGVYLELREPTRHEARAVLVGDKPLRLVLRNNYRFSIQVPTFPVDDKAFAQKPVNEEVGVVYEVKSTAEESNRVLRSADAPHVITGYLLEPGEELRFSIPANHLAESEYLQVPFKISAESVVANGRTAPQHFAVFYGATLTR